MGKRLLETTFPLLHLLSIVSPYCCWVEKFLSKHALADYQLSLPSFTFAFDVLWLSTCSCWASFSTVLFALYFFYCGCLLFLGWTGCSLRFSLKPFLSCLLLLLLAWKGFRRGWGQLLSAVSSFLCIPSLVLVCCCWGWQVASLGATLDEGAKVSWNNLAPLVYRYSFLFLGWNGFSLNKLWPIINYHLLLSRLHLMSCHYLLAVAGPDSQLLPLLCSRLLVVVCCFWGGQAALLGITVWGNASSK